MTREDGTEGYRPETDQALQDALRALAGEPMTPEEIEAAERKRAEREAEQREEAKRAEYEFRKRVLEACDQIGELRALAVGGLIVWALVSLFDWPEAAILYLTIWAVYHLIRRVRAWHKRRRAAAAAARPSHASA